MRSGLARVVFRVVNAPAFAIASALLFVPVVARADEGAASPVHAAALCEVSEAREARTQIETTLAEMRVTALRVRDQLRLTRKRGTTQQVTCVDEALSRADVALRHARGLGDEILTAYGRGDGETARAARRRLAELRGLQRFASLQATKCTPSASPPINLVLTNTTTVKVDVDSRIPRVD
jgi:hypothetical protein